LTGEPLKPEDDILYQWRLRRKLEQQHCLSPQKSISVQNTHPVIAVPREIYENNNQNSSEQLSKNIRVKESEKTVETNFNDAKSSIKHSICTQTNILTDSCVQTSLDVDNIPTLDQNHIKNVESKKTSCSIEKHQSVTKFPSKQIKIKPKIEIQNQQKQLEIPKQAYKAPSFSQHHNNTGKKILNTIERQSTFTSISTLDSITTTSSSINSTLTNISTSNSPTLPQSQFEHEEILKTQFAHASKSQKETETNNQSKKTSSKDLNKTVIISKPFNSNSGSGIASDERFSAFVDSSTSNYQHFDENDKDLFESDEILQMLFKKTYYYQMKIK
jgi:hypothetical protein